MSLKPCRECGHQVSTDAKACPSCGVERPAKKDTTGWSALLGVLVVGALGLTCAYFLGNGGSNSTGPAPQRANLAPPAPKHAVRYATSTVNIRSGPGTGYKVVSTAKPGEKVYIGDTEKGWAPVFSWLEGKDTTGFVYTKILGTAPPPNLQVFDVKWERGEYGESYATGKVRNNSGGSYSYVQVEISVYDAAGTRIGSTLDNVTNLEPGSVWRFKAPILEDEAHTFKVTDVSGY